MWPLWAALGAIVTLLALLGVLWCCKPRPPRRLQAMFRWAWGVYAQLSLGAKIKQLMSFFQVVTRLAEVHQLQLPTQVYNLTHFACCVASHYSALYTTHTEAADPCAQTITDLSYICCAPHRCSNCSRRSTFLTST